MLDSKIKRIYLSGYLSVYHMVELKSTLLILVWIANSEFWIHVLKYLEHSFFLPFPDIRIDLTNSTAASSPEKVFVFYQTYCFRSQKKTLKWPVSAFLMVWSNIFSLVYIFWENLSHRKHQKITFQWTWIM